MWHFVQRSGAPNSELLGAIRDLLEATSRWIIIVVTLLIIPALLSGVIWPDALARNLWLVVPVAVITCVLSLSLLERHFALTQIIWQAGLAATLVAVIRVFSIPEAAFLAILLPMMAVVTLGWPLALASEALIGLLSLWLYRGLVTPAPPASYGWIIVIGGGISWAIAHATSHSLVTATQWSFYSYREARERVEEARNQRLELAQIQEDLLKANGELARMADRLRTVSRAAEEARQTKEEFVANVSHELRTPLNMIIGFSEMITQAPQVYGERLPAALLADITAIQRNSRHLSKLVDDVLDLSQIDAGRMTLSRDWTDLRDVIGEAIAAVTVLYDSKHLYLRAEIADDLPGVYCDETRIRQVLLNLLSNSGRFTARGGVTIRAGRQDGKVVVNVTDTGPGIAEEDQARLFQPFQQLDSSIRRQHGGSGLGLSISRRFVDMHGGKMWLESTLGEGTTFFFSLPIEDPMPIALGARGDAQRWFNRYRRYMPRTRGWKAPDPELVPRYVVLEEGAALQRLDLPVRGCGGRRCGLRRGRYGGAETVAGARVTGQCTLVGGLRDHPGTAGGAAVPNACDVELGAGSSGRRKPDGGRAVSHKTHLKGRAPGGRRGIWG